MTIKRQHKVLRPLLRIANCAILAPMFTRVTVPVSSRAFQDRSYAREVLHLDGLPAFGELATHAAIVGGG